MKLRLVIGLTTGAISLALAAWGSVELYRAASAGPAPVVPFTNVKRGNVTFAVYARGELQGGNSKHPGKGPDLAQADTPPLRQVCDLDLHPEPGDVRDEPLPIPVEDRAARRLDPHVAQLVVLCSAQQLIAVQDLQ